MPAKATPIQTNFTAGEISPRLYGRVDISKYYNGCKTLENFIVMPHGGANRRPGSIWVQPVKYENQKSRLIPFEFNTTQAYIIELGNKYMRFYTDNDQIVIAATITNATQANPCVITTSAAHGHLNGDVVTITGVVGMTELNGNTYTVANASDTTFELQGIDSTGYTAYTSDGNSTGPYGILSPFKTAELFDIQFAQDADVMWLCHNNVKTQKLTRTAHTSWTLTDYAPTNDPFTGASQTITGATQANPCVITITGHNYSDGDRISIDSVGGMTELNGKTYVIANTTANTFELENIDSTNYTAYTTGGNGVKSDGDYPACVTFFEQRIVLGNTNNDPDKFWGSKSGDYEDHTQTPVADDMAYEYQIASGKVNEIRWMAPGEDLLIGTAGDAFRARGGVETPISPTNISVKPQASNKSKFIQPVTIDGHAIFVQRAGLKLRDMGYRFELNKYKADDLTILSEHITDSGVVELDYQEEPDSIIWAGLTDGTLLGVTYNKDQDVVGWHKHILGGTSAVVESIATIPGIDYDETWIIVKRTINGSTKRYIEYFHSGVWDDQGDYIYLDSAFTYSGADTTTITGLDHLEGETVQVVNNGAVETDKTVSSGQITLDNTSGGDKVHIGLGYTSTLETLQPEAGNPAGSAQGRKKKWSNLRVKVYRSLGGKIQEKELNWLVPGHIMGSPPSVFTGDITQADLGYSAEGTIKIEQHLPLPFTVLSITGNLHVGDY